MRRPSGPLRLVALGVALAAGCDDAAPPPQRDATSDVHVAISAAPGGLMRMVENLDVDSANAAAAVAMAAFRMDLAFAVTSLPDIQPEVPVQDREAFIPEAGALLGTGMIGRPGVRGRPGVGYVILGNASRHERTSVVLGPTVSASRLLVRVRVVDPQGTVRDDFFAAWPDEPGRPTLEEAVERTLRVVERSTGRTRPSRIRSAEAPGSPLLAPLDARPVLGLLRHPGDEPYGAIRILVQEGSYPPRNVALRHARYLLDEGAADSPSLLVRALSVRRLTQVLRSELGYPDGTSIPGGPASIGLPADLDSLAALAVRALPPKGPRQSLLEQLLRVTGPTLLTTTRPPLEALAAVSAWEEIDPFDLYPFLADAGCMGGWTLTMRARSSDAGSGAAWRIGVFPDAPPPGTEGQQNQIPRRILAGAPEAWKPFFSTDPWLPPRFASVARVVHPLADQPERRAVIGRQIREAYLARDTLPADTLEGRLTRRIAALRSITPLVPGRDYELASALAMAGDDGAALTLLEELLGRRDVDLVVFEYDPAWERLRSRPRFQRVIDTLYRLLDRERALFLRLEGQPFSNDLAREIVASCLAPL